MYDSTKDTLKHKIHVCDVLNKLIISELSKRAVTHDDSKLKAPEKQCYDQYIPLLRQHKYGTPEYEECRVRMKEDGMDHHFLVNRHHPEHFQNGIKDMTIVDVVELLCDWFAASLRSDTTFMEGLDRNVEKYGIPEELKSIFINTYNEYFKDYESTNREKK